jgi:SprT protein
MRIKIDDSFTIEQKNIIYSCLKDYKNKIDLGDKLLYLEIKNSGRLKTTAGNARTLFSKKAGIVKMNKRLFSSTAGIKEFTNTFTHELAHIIANFKEGKACGHNIQWKSLHRLLGGNAKTTHNYCVDHLKPVTKRFEYKCGCSIHRITKARHNKILRGSRFSCNSCKVYIKRVL